MSPLFYSVSRFALQIMFLLHTRPLRRASLSIPPDRLINLLQLSLTFMLSAHVIGSGRALMQNRPPTRHYYLHSITMTFMTGQTRGFTICRLSSRPPLLMQRVQYDGLDVVADDDGHTKHSVDIVPWLTRLSIGRTGARLG